MNLRTTVVVLVMVVAVLAAFFPERPGEMALVAALQGASSMPAAGRGG